MNMCALSQVPDYKQGQCFIMKIIDHCGYMYNYVVHFCIEICNTKIM